MRRAPEGSQGRRKSACEEASHVYAVVRGGGAGGRGAGGGGPGGGGVGGMPRVRRGGGRVGVRVCTTGRGGGARTTGK